MKNNKRKCPRCGATIPANAKTCPKCNAVLDSGRVSTLTRNDTIDQQEEVLHDLPRPVRPTEELEGDDSTKSYRQHSDGQEFGEGRMSDEGQGYKGPSNGRTPRPVETARTNYSSQKSDRHVWQIAAVLAIILVVVIVAIILVIRLNQRPASDDESSQTKEPSPEFVMEEPSTSPAPTTSSLVITPVPSSSSSPSPTPTSTPSTRVTITTPTPTISPLFTPTPSPSTNSSSSFNVTPVNETVYLTGGGVNIRKGPGTDYDVIGNESTGYTFTRTGRTSNGWSRVLYNGAEGYVSDSFLSTTKPTATPAASYSVTPASGTVTVTTAANLRKGPGTDYESIGVVSAGTQLTRTGYVSGWTRVQYSGQDVFIASNLISDGTSSGGSTTSGTVTITGNLVNIRSGPGTNYSAIGSVNAGTMLTCTGQSGDWYQVVYNGQTGYVISTYAIKS